MFFWCRSTDTFRFQIPHSGCSTGKTNPKSENFSERKRRKTKSSRNEGVYVHPNTALKCRAGTSNRVRRGEGTPGGWRHGRAPQAPSAFQEFQPEVKLGTSLISESKARGHKSPQRHATAPQARKAGAPQPDVQVTAHLGKECRPLSQWWSHWQLRWVCD